jgi:hypothetical protein
MQKSKLLSLIFILSSSLIYAQERGYEKFKQLDQELPTPNQYHNAAGAPGHQYWQQKADYDIRVRLDDNQQRIYGEETVTYYNNSPDMLTYLWLQLDQNIFDPNSDRAVTQTNKIDPKGGSDQILNLHDDFDGGFKVEEVKSKSGTALNYTINKTMMRIDLPAPLKPVQSVRVYGVHTPEWVYIESFIFPEKYFAVYANILNIDEDLLRAVGELCEGYNREKETFINQLNTIKNEQVKDGLQS